MFNTNRAFDFNRENDLSGVFRKIEFDDSNIFDKIDENELSNLKNNYDNF